LHDIDDFLDLINLILITILVYVYLV